MATFRPSVLSLPPGMSHVGSRFDRARTRLAADWRAMLRARDLAHDLRAGTVVGLAAVPISMGIALATDVPTGLGLTSAVVATFVAALFGASRPSISGPAAALAVLVGQIVDRHGLAVLPVVGALAGGVQIAVGMLGASRLARAVPPTVVQGFATGIALTLIIGQLPAAFGLPPIDESHVLDVVVHLARYASQAHPTALACAAFATAAVALGPTRTRVIPWALVAVAVPTAAHAWLRLDPTIVPTTAEALPPFASWPARAWPTDASDLVLDATAIFAIASVEALTRASVLDRGAPAERAHDPDQELVAQGLANVAAAAAFGVPATAAPERTALAHANGARTRRAALISALVVLGASWAAAPWLARIPIAALAGVVIGLGLRMLSLERARSILRGSRADAAVFASTVASMVAFDVGPGVQTGVLVALGVALVRVTRTRSEVEEGRKGLPHHASLTGALTFLAASRIDSLARQLVRLPIEPGFVIDLRDVESIDRAALDALAALVASLHERGAKIALLGARAEVAAEIHLGQPALGPLLTTREADLDKVLDVSRHGRGRRELVQGVRRFRRDARDALSPLLAELAEGQAPHTLMLTCADSRVVPSLLTDTQPGELFVVRNIGALLPPFGHETLNDEGAALEYAIEVLGVRNVVVCGHTKCGAMGALKKGKLPDGLGALAHWAAGAKALASDPSAHPSVDDLARATTLKQLDHLRSYPVVRDALSAGELTLAAWFYDVERAEVLEWNDEHERYVPIGEPIERRARLSALPPVARGDVESGEVSS
jgi:carbonic anhydrase